MAKTNKDAAFGLRAIGKVGQNRDNQGLGEYSISSGDTTKIFFQDKIKIFNFFQIAFFFDYKNIT